MKRSDLNFIVDAIALVGVAALTSTGIIMRFILPPFRGGRWKYSSPMTLWEMDRHQWGEIHFWISIGLMAVLVFHLFLHWHWIVSVVCNKSREGSGIRAVLGLLSLIALLTATVSPFFVSIEEAPRHKMERGKRHQQKSGSDLAPPNQNEVHQPMEQGAPLNDEILPKPKTSTEIKEELILKEPEHQAIPDTTGSPSDIETQVPVSEEHTKSHKQSISGIDIRGNMTLQEVEDSFGVPVGLLLEKLGLPEDTAPDERLGRLRRQFDFKMSEVRKAVEKHLEAQPPGLNSSK
jgi:hypothetical protein